MAKTRGQVVLDRAGFGTRVPDAHRPPSPPERWGETGSLEYLRVEGRETFDSDSVLLSLRAAL